MAKARTYARRQRDSVYVVKSIVDKQCGAVPCKGLVASQVGVIEPEGVSSFGSPSRKIAVVAQYSNLTRLNRSDKNAYVVVTNIDQFWFGRGIEKGVVQNVIALRN